MFSQGKVFSSASEIHQFQFRELKKQLRYLQEFSPFYKNLFLQHHTGPDKLLTLNDLALFPVTGKEHLQQAENDFLCIPPTAVAEYFTTSGTSGEPLVFPVSENDLNRLAYNEFMSFRKMEINAEDCVLITVTSDRCFMAGNAYSLGLRKTGATVIKTGPGLPELQWAAILKLKPTAIVAVPSFLLKLIDFAEKKGIDYRNCSIKKALCVGEPLRKTDLTENALAENITARWPIKLYSTYATTEISTAFTECNYGCGGHLNPELVVLECLDKNDRPVEDGTPGEITITTLGTEAMPLLRFKTGDIASVYYDPCACGDPSPRIGPIIGRNKQMIKYKGTTLYPDAIKQTLQRVPLVQEFYTEVATDSYGMDDLIVHLHVSELNQETENQVADAFRSHLRVLPKLSFETREQVLAVKINPGLRKPVDFVDNRTLN